MCYQYICHMIEKNIPAHIGLKEEWQLFANWMNDKTFDIKVL